MKSTLAAILLLFVVGTVRADEPPIVDVIREVIYEVDQDLIKNHQDYLDLPNLGILPWDPIKLRNGKLGVFSTMELVGDQDVVQKDRDDGAMELVLNLNAALGTISLQYDFRVSVLGLYVRTGVVEVKTSNDTAHANVTVVIDKDGKCSASLNSAYVSELDGFEILVQPDAIPNLTLINQALLNFITPQSLPLVNVAIEKIIGTDLLQQKFSELLCSKLPF